MCRIPAPRTAGNHIPLLEEFAATAMSTCDAAQGLQQFTRFGIYVVAVLISQAHRTHCPTMIRSNAWVNLIYCSCAAMTSRDFFAHDMTPIDNKTTISSYDPLPVSASYRGFALGDFERNKTGVLCPS